MRSILVGLHAFHQLGKGHVGKRLAFCLPHENMPGNDDGKRPYRQGVPNLATAKPTAWLRLSSARRRASTAKWSAAGKTSWGGKDQPWAGTTTTIFEKQANGSLKLKVTLQLMAEQQSPPTREQAVGGLSDFSRNPLEDPANLLGRPLAASRRGDRVVVEECRDLAEVLPRVL